MESQIAIVQTTLDDDTKAQALALELLDARLAACVQLISNVRSFYCWQGRCENSLETLLTLKTTPELATRVRDWLASRHPYEVPEIIIDEVTASETYARWVRQQVCAP